MELILTLVECQILALTTVHIPGEQNQLADFFSYQHLDQGMWSFHLEVFQELCCRWGTLYVDLLESWLKKN